MSSPEGDQIVPQLKSDCDCAEDGLAPQRDEVVDEIPPAIAQAERAHTVWVLVGGALGGLTSLIARLHDFAVMEREPGGRLFFTELPKPVPGIVLALVI
jgi:hypothetical protein